MENMNRITIVDVRELPMGQPLETPLHPKRRRMWRACDQAPQSVQTPQAYGGSSKLKAEPSSPSYSTDPLQENEMVMGPSTLSYSTDPLQENEMVAGPSSLSYCIDPLQENEMVMMVTENVEIKMEIVDNMPVSPQREIEESGGSSGPSTAARRRRLDRVPLGYGSEPESEESDEEEVVGSRIPRAFRSLLDTPIDDEPAPPPAPPATDQPGGLFDFHWEAFPTRPVPPESRRERFLDSNGGPTTPCVDPYDIFVAIWNRQFVEYIASETNRYAQQLADQKFFNNDLSPHSRINRWCDTTADELYVFFGIVIAMGVVVKSRLEEYWSSAQNIFNTPGFSTHMSLNRFLLLSKCLHFNNNEIMRAHTLGVSETKLFKIQPVLTHLNDRFSSLYYPSRNISIDESLLMWKGWLDINQFIPNKAAKVGIKSYELCESQTGYLWRFEIHAHKRSPPQQSEDPLNASTSATVLRLLQGLENRGHTVWMDSMYNSPIIARRLKCLGFDCVGTLRTNRKFVPQELHSLTKNDMRPGQLTGLTSGDVDVMVWRDNNRVAMLTTYHGNAVSRDGESTKPILIMDYNIMMGGVDKKDQLLAMYPIERKRTRVWYKKLFRRLLNASILNSYVIHRGSTNKPLSHRNFRMQLVLSLLAKHCERSPPLRAPEFEHLKPRARADALHRIAQYQMGGDNRQRRRRRCVVCKKRVNTYCVVCNKTVCIGDKCFVSIHS